MAYGRRLLVKKEVAIAIIYESENNILLQLRDFKAEISHPGEWAFFGGSIECGESPCEALIRELKEELNFVATVPVYFRKYYYEVDGLHP